MEVLGLASTSVRLAECVQLYSEEAARLNAAVGPRLLTGLLAALGYKDMGADVVPGHHLFGRGEDRTHLLHVAEYQSATWNEAL